MNVLICGAANVIAIGTARLLLQAGHRAVLADSNRLARAFHSKYCATKYLFRDPAVDLAGFEKDLAECLRKERIALVVPTTDQALLDLVAARGAIPESVACPFPLEADKIRLVLQKGNFAGIGEAAGIRTPRTLRHAEVKGLDPDGLTPPWVIKRAVGMAGEGLAKVAKRSMLAPILTRTMQRYPGEELLLQEYIDGKVYGAGGLFDGQGLRRFYCYEYVNRLPRGCGPATRCLLQRINPVREAFAKVVAALDWRGYCQMDFVVDNETLEPCLVDINPVHWYTMPFSASPELNSLWGYLGDAQNASAGESMVEPYATVCLSRELQRLLAIVAGHADRPAESLGLFAHARAFRRSDFYWDPLPILLIPFLRLLDMARKRGK